MRAPKNSQPVEGIVTSDGGRAKRKIQLPKFKLPKSRNGKLIVAVSGVVVLVLVVIGVAALLHKDTQNVSTEDGGNLYLISDKEFGQREENRLKKLGPPSNATVGEKRSFYQNLMLNQYAAEDYKGVTDSYKALVAAVSDHDMSSQPYALAARAYAKQGDKGAAQAVLSRADAAAANVSDPEAKASFQQSIAAVREEINNE
jgi:hypothetical protein